MSQIGTPRLAVFNPRFAESSASSSIRCLPDTPMRRSFDSDRSAETQLWLRLPHPTCVQCSSSNSL
jgi:hypothetical protein